jgi:RNA polymerase-binding transcription factor DksA
MKGRALPKNELNEFKALLVERGRRLRGDLDTLEGETLKKGADGAGDLSTIPGHLAELASDSSERELSYGRMESQSEELKEIEEALDRIKDGSFGFCEKCEARIPKERLRAIPYARRCVKCQSKEEGA